MEAKNNGLKDERILVVSENGPIYQGTRFCMASYSTTPLGEDYKVLIVGLLQFLVDKDGDAGARADFSRLSNRYCVRTGRGDVNISPVYDGEGGGALPDGVRVDAPLTFFMELPGGRHISLDYTLSTLNKMSDCPIRVMNGPSFGGFISGVSVAQDNPCSVSFTVSRSLIEVMFDFRHPFFALFD